MHIAESAALVPYLPLRAGATWLDLGTGGGLPGLVLAVERPDVSWRLLDSTAKKIAEVRRFARALGVGNVTTLVGRAEELAHDDRHRGRYDGVVARAVAPLGVLAELARGFLRPGARLAAVKGPTWDQELETAGPALRALALRVAGAERVASTPRATWVVSLDATGPPPRGYPRAVGIPAKAPLSDR